MNPMNVRMTGLGLIVAACLWAIPAQAAERSIPYADMHKVFERIERLKGGQYVKPFARFSTTAPGLTTKDIRLTVKSRTGDIPVNIAEDGTADFPVREDLLEENPAVVTNVPEGKLSVQVSLTVEAPPLQRFKYSYLTAMQDEADAMIAKQGFMARMFLPDFDGFQISFPPGTEAHAIVETKKGLKRFDTDKDGNIVIPDRGEWRKVNPEIKLSARPTTIALQVD